MTTTKTSHIAAIEAFVVVGDKDYAAGAGLKAAEQLPAQRCSR